MSTEYDYDYLFKIIVIGDSGVGKSSILFRFVDDNFNDSFISTIGIDFKIKTITIDNKIIKLQIWDTAGQERFRTITSSYYRGANGIIVVYDVTNRDSYNNIIKWLGEIDKYTRNDTITIIVGNKCDLESTRLVEYKEAEEFASQFSIPYIETSAKTSSNITNVFTTMSNEIAKYIDDIGDDLVNKKTTRPVINAKVNNNCEC